MCETFKLLLLRNNLASSAEFVEMVFSAANGISEKEKKATISPDHVLAAIEQLELTSLEEPLTAYLQTLKDIKGNPAFAYAGFPRPRPSESSVSTVCSL